MALGILPGDCIAETRAEVVPAGKAFTCTPTAVWDGDGPIWCAEGPKVRIAGVAAREMDGSCRPNQPCPTVDAIDARDRLVRLLGGPRGRLSTPKSELRRCSASRMVQPAARAQPHGVRRRCSATFHARPSSQAAPYAGSDTGETIGAKLQFPLSTQADIRSLVGGHLLTVGVSLQHLGPSRCFRDM